MDRRQMLRAAAALFSRQAIRSQQDLQGSVPGLTGQDADVVLPRLAYMFRNGETQHGIFQPSAEPVPSATYWHMPGTVCTVHQSGLQPQHNIVSHCKVCTLVTASMGLALHCSCNDAAGNGI